VRRSGGLTREAERILLDAVERFSLSGRGFDRAIRVGRTIADLDGRPRVDAGDVAEALIFRALSAAPSIADVG
jgi:magnesium chelatase family protein